MSEEDRSQNGRESSPWHPGERILQETVGVADRMAAVGSKVLRPYMPEQHRNFYQQLPFILAGVIDNKNRPWATFLTGIPGFIKTPDPQQLTINSLPEKQDPAFSGFINGAPVGLLGIELHTRRRNRANGVIDDLTAEGFQVNVQQTMGNCPKYIQMRDIEFTDKGKIASSEKNEFPAADDQHVKAMIEKADTFFVATYADTPEGRTADVSHRGGKPGFVRVDADGTLTIPDFSGNLFFNTLGNIYISRQAGLIFPDFESGDILQLSGAANIISDSREAEQFAGAERVWKVWPEKIVYRREVLPFRWQYRETSSHLRKTGTWAVTD